MLVRREAEPSWSTTSERGTFSLGKRPPLTGIRALALIPVVVYHSNYSWFPGSWISLQVFFVLSGFLITSLLAAEARRHDRISLKRFYSRRIVRLYPPMLLTVILLAVYSSFVHVTNASSRLWGDALAALFYYYNWREAFGHGAFLGYFGVCWSLAIEEQFYIIWAVLMVVAVAVHHRRLAYSIAVFGVIYGVIARMLFVESSTFGPTVYERIYNGFDTRADALFLGCLLGLLANDGWLSNWAPWARRTLSVAGTFGFLCLAWATTQSFSLFATATYVYFLATAASVALIAHFVVSPASWLSRFAGLKPIVFVGNISYTIYLIHLPVYFAIMKYGPKVHIGSFHWVLRWILCLILIGTIATLSWFTIEKPLQRWRDRSAAA
jgi:peptidoglycan/LPS O-acetylase OafA/YrhL